ncbi:MAG: hypothetical protein VX127_00075 [Myxococcota bacterium]|nr:hypothetical protein [Myxococcota bacterium]
MNRIHQLLWDRVRLWLPFALGVALLGTVVGRMDAVPTGDAPHLLAIADKLNSLLNRGEYIEFLESWSSLVTPHPPAGFAVPVLMRWLDLGLSVPLATSVVGLGLAWHGMVLLSRVGGRVVHGPWMGAVMLFAMPATWTFSAHMVWDVLAAGCVTACIGHLHASDGLRNMGHAALFGVFMGLSFVTKYTAPAFLVLPAAFAGVAVLRFGSWTGLLVAIGAFAVVGGPWLFTHGDSVVAYVLSSSGATQTISASPASSWSARFAPENLLYYPTVLRDMVGWPGVGLMLLALAFAWRKPGGRWAALGVVGGAVVLTFAGENQSRYVYPALPLLGAIIDVGLRPGLHSALARLGMVCGLAATMPSLVGGWMTVNAEATHPPTRDQTHAAESLLAWGAWPSAAMPFRPVSNPVEAWDVDAALSALAAESGETDYGHQVGILLPNDARLPPGSTYAWRAGSLGMDWNFATVVPRGPAGKPMVFVGPLKPVGIRMSRRFDVGYAIHPKGSMPELMKQLSAQLKWQHDLPHSLQGSVFRVPAAGWRTPFGVQLQKDPIDG